MSEIGAENANHHDLGALKWFVIFALVLLFHILLSMVRIQPRKDRKATAVEIIDLKKVAAIRRKLKSRTLLLDQGQPETTDQAPPEDANYFSNRNIRVEKEQRARIIEDSADAEKKPSAQARQEKPLPKLGTLGVPFNLNGSQGPPQPSSKMKAQFIMDPSLPEGSENLLNARESSYYSFFSRVHGTVVPLWRQGVSRSVYTHGLIPGAFFTAVRVYLDRSGVVEDVLVVKNSGSDVYDREAKEVWKKVGIFPNPPKDLLDGEGRMFFNFGFTVSTDF